MSRTEPPVSEASIPFWEATRRRQLVLQWCVRCDQPIHYPREVCPSCLSEDLEWREASGKGEVHAFTILREPADPAMADKVPYVVALIDLAEGARLMSNVVGCEPEAVTVGLPVRVTWEELSDGRALPLFTPRG
jgi:uncharacterized OB-fold protein